MSTYVIQGGTPLFGSVRVGGAKNASYKLMIAALLAKSPSRLLNFSHISDVALVARLIEMLGGRAHQVGERAYVVDPANLNQWTISREHGEASRASTMFIPALLHRFGRAEVPLPGGDKIGRRPLERHFQGLQAMGARVTEEADLIRVEADGLKGADYTFAKNSHTGTETLVMAAALAEGKTILRNAAEETEVDDLITFLNAMGAKIRRTEPRTIEIEGVTELQGAIFKIMPDQNQVVSFACAALATKGDVIVENARPDDLEIFLAKLKAAGAGYEVGSYGIRFFYQQPLRAVEVTTAIHPGFKTDWQPLWVTMMTQAEGDSILHETVSQNRFQYVESLNTMGADIELFNPQVENPEAVYNFNWDDRTDKDRYAAKIHGPSLLTAGEFTVKDLRHGATLMIAGMIARGTTVLHDPDHHIDRGYELLDTQFRSMGAQIERHSL
ncbi:MAG TPA: UDP-N-acetylglucosamine 1-carboxyvinyltransferase [Vitreimonas sp.]|nr:UDP-N-acetylglucosamine 1-carboxyvinyltransferase [Vitreimonas sp.]